MKLCCFRKIQSEGKSGKIKPKQRIKIEFLPKKFLTQIGKWLKNPDSFEFVLQNEVLYAVPKSISKDYKFLVNWLKIKQYGIEMGRFAGKKLIPTHHLAMSHLLSEKIPKIELSYPQAINYLRKQEVEVETNVTGWAIATYQNHSLGWMKVLPNRINNYYPIELRLRKEFEVE